MPKQQFAPSKPKLIFATLVLLAALLFAGSTYYLVNPSHMGSGTGTALIGGPFTLTDQTGKKVTEKDFLGHYMLVFFGYTYCPDVCPTELQVMSAALDSMGSKADNIQPVFITIDPQRDTADVMKQYVSNFYPRLIGLTGTPEEVANVAKVYRVYYSKVESKSGANDYLMDHSSIVYLMDTHGTFLKHFTYTTDAAELAKAIEAAIAPQK
jgi:cytochrome oxidase Cu insertion factor (SCO1/SenC/PrrC family)